MKTWMWALIAIAVLVGGYFVYQYFSEPSEIGISTNGTSKIFQEGENGKYFLQYGDGTKEEITKTVYDSYSFDSTKIPVK